MNPTAHPPEHWLSGPVPGITPLLQPVAHALLQSRREIREALNNFRDEWLWMRPAGVASVAFHLQHIAGVQDRMMSYARGTALTPEQLARIPEEGREAPGITVGQLIAALHEQVDRFLDYLAAVDPAILTDARTVGRKQLPSTLIGILFHAAEHSMRHTGQLLVTAAVIRH